MLSLIYFIAVFYRSEWTLVFSGLNSKSKIASIFIAPKLISAANQLLPAKFSMILFVILESNRSRRASLLILKILMLFFLQHCLFYFPPSPSARHVPKIFLCFFLAACGYQCLLSCLINPYHFPVPTGTLTKLPLESICTG